MEKKTAKKIVELLNNSENFISHKFEIKEDLVGRYLENFHRWADNKEHLGSFLISEKNNKNSYWFVFIEWNSNNGYYLIIFPENKEGPYIEIQKTEIQNFIWRYKPSRRDGRNLERKEYFSKYFGDVEVTISIPTNNDEISDFIEDIFQLTETRIKSDELSENIPIERTVFIEGRRVERKHYARERNSNLITKVKKDFKKKYGTHFCEVCDFNFADKYGERGKDFIEAHHTRPLSELDENGSETKPEEIVLVCANCHRMIHKTRPWLNINELQKILE